MAYMPGLSCYENMPLVEKRSEKDVSLPMKVISRSFHVTMPRYGPQALWEGLSCTVS